MIIAVGRFRAVDGQQLAEYAATIAGASGRFNETRRLALGATGDLSGERFE
jgi:hypothetical protein